MTTEPPAQEPAPSTPPPPPPHVEPESATASGQGGRTRRRRLLTPALACVAGLLVGVVVGSQTTPDYTETQEYADAHAELDERASQQDGRDDQLDTRADELAQFEDDVAAIDQRGAELDEREQGLDTREADLDTRAGKLDTRSAELDDREAVVSAAETAFEEGTVPGNGVYLVGDDIAPGQYRGNTGNGSCYWARLSGTGGGFDDIIANDNVEGSTVVTISESDAAFETNRCGEWHLLQ